MNRCFRLTFVRQHCTKLDNRRCCLIALRARGVQLWLLERTLDTVRRWPDGALLVRTLHCTSQRRGTAHHRGPLPLPLPTAAATEN